jgi:hypothetical protein
MEYASEMVIKAAIFGQRIVEVPITLYKDGRSRPPHLRTWRDGWRHLRFMLAYAPNWVFFFPGALMSIIGALTVIWLVPGVQVVGNVMLDINTMVIAASVFLLGIQIMLFGILAKQYMTTRGLIPTSARFARINRVISLEYGLIASLFILATGIWFIAQVFGVWQSSGFQFLNTQASARMTLIGGSLMILAGQVGFTSILVSILGLDIRHGK